jgi:uncharacterized damage-inducible protein DinB
MIERQLDTLFRDARAIPADKLDWKPTPESRSALDQLQEVATASDTFWDGLMARKIRWEEDVYIKWVAERSHLTTIDALEAHSRASHARLYEYILSLSDEQLEEPFEMPFPGEWKLADVLTYYHYNASYHNGQITYIGTLLTGAPA